MTPLIGTKALVRTITPRMIDDVRRLSGITLNEPRAKRMQTLVTTLCALRKQVERKKPVRA